MGIDIKENGNLPIYVHNKNEYSIFKKYAKKLKKDPITFLYEIQEKMGIPENEQGHFGPKTIKFLKELYKKEISDITKQDSDIIYTDVTDHLLSYITTKDIKNIESKIINKGIKIDLVSNMGKRANIENAKNLVSNIEAINKVVFEYFDNEIIKENSSFIKRLSWLITDGFINARLLRPAHTVLEESAHQDKSILYGHDANIGIMGGEEDMSIYELYFYQLLHPKSRGAEHTDETSITSYEEENHVVGAGINSHTDYSINFIRNNIKNGKTGVTDLSYFQAKLYGTYYYYMSLKGKLYGDPDVYVLFLKEQGIDIKVKDLYKYSLLSTILSGGTLNTINASLQYLKNGEQSVDNIGFKIGNTFISLPEFNIFLRKNGVSGKIDITILDKNKEGYTLGIEKNIRGNVPTEVSASKFGIYEDWEYEIGGSINTKGGITVSGSVTHLITDDLGIYGGINYSNGKNNDGYGKPNYNIHGGITFKF